MIIRVQKSQKKKRIEGKDIDEDQDFDEENLNKGMRGKSLAYNARKGNKAILASQGILLEGKRWSEREREMNRGESRDSL